MAEKRARKMAGFRPFYIKETKVSDPRCRYRRHRQIFFIIPIWNISDPALHALETGSPGRSPQNPPDADTQGLGKSTCCQKGKPHNTAPQSIFGHKDFLTIREEDASGIGKLKKLLNASSSACRIERTEGCVKLFL